MIRAALVELSQLGGHTPHPRGLGDPLAVEPHVLVAQLPTDPATIFTMILIFAVAGVVLWYGRPKGGGGNGPR